MSLIIKDIDLPKEGEEITLEINHKGEVRAYSTELKETDTNTQAIQIPTPHGRLIDGDEFKSWVDDWYDCTYIGNIVESWIDERPTILEAEE